MKLFPLLSILSPFLVFACVSAQPLPGEVNIICASRAPVFYIYQINGLYLAPPEYSQSIRFPSRHITRGRHYFKRNHAGFRMHHIQGKVPEGTQVKTFQGDCIPIDTMIFKDIRLKYPLEIDGKLLEDTPGSTTENHPLIFTRFEFVNSCPMNPQAHYEIESRK